jgi:hypothetical protein
MPLDGDWYNELKSKMVLSVKGADITGHYHTEVGDATGIYELRGRVDTKGGRSRAIGFVVSWENEHGRSESVTTWSGEVETNDQGEDRIFTTWLLTKETDPANNWKSTLVRQDVFSRTPPDPAKVTRVRMLKPRSHPASAGKMRRE